jgi:hypothetical protein
VSIRPWPNHDPTKPGGGVTREGPVVVGLAAEVVGAAVVGLAAGVVDAVVAGDGGAVVVAGNELAGLFTLPCPPVALDVQPAAPSAITPAATQ